MKYVLIILVAMLNILAVRAQIPYFEKSIINYLGTDFIVPDGCPKPSCDPTNEECKKANDIVVALYAHCIQSQDGQYLGCITEQLGGHPNAPSITIPVYATLCSAMCYEPRKEKLALIHRCPHPGFRKHDPVLNSLF